ncbi:uncharacterized protein LOC118439077 isoform X2 [Folsomia candida]|uniref:uncharacterized protein LOC118439077 isoform X2 n=1 Tax=Folsomia candida TaxID=158441 RepID=UPI001604C965|nr:uncharacterized protein LOC118439077 isoform X2 [Folsomia candida]
MSFRTGGIAVLAAVSLKSQTALTAKVAQLKKKIMDKHYSLALLVQEFILIACLWAVFITIGTESIRPTMDIRIWAWFFLIVLTSCGICIYYLWLVKGRQPSIFWGNEMLQLELDLKKSTLQLYRIQNQDPTTLDALILLGLKIFVWTGYLFTPMGSLILMVIGVDPTFYIVNYLMNSSPLTTLLLRTFTFNNAILLDSVILVARFVSVTVALYEGERVLFIVLGSVYIIIYTADTIVGLLQKTVHINRRRIQIGLFHRHIKLYVMLQLAVQAVEDIVKVTLSMGIVACMVVLVTMTFVSIRLRHLLPGYLLVFPIFTGVFSFFLGKTLLTKTGGIYKSIVGLLRSFRAVGIMRGMRRSVKQGYVRDVRRLSKLKIPIGIGSAVFATVNQNTNVGLTRLFVEITVNALILF